MRPNQIIKFRPFPSILTGLLLSQVLTTRTATGEVLDGESLENDTPKIDASETAPHLVPGAGSHDDVEPGSERSETEMTPNGSAQKEGIRPPENEEGDGTGIDASEDEMFFSDEDEELEFEAVAEVEAPPREPTKRTLDKAQLTIIPGTRGDALRAIEIMPGVGRTAFGANDGPPLLRGSSPFESLVLLDGAEVPLIYHFGGLTSFFNSHLLEEVNLYPGNYSARYGRQAGGVVEAKVRDPTTEGLHALVELSAIDSFALVEAPVSKKTSIALAARRSNIDFFFDAFIPDDTATILAAPVYWDYQAILAHRFNESNKLRVIGYGSHDQMELVFSDSAPDDPALQGDFDVSVGFHRVQIELESKFSNVVEQNVMVSAGPAGGTQALGAISSEFRFWEVNARAEWSIFATPWLRVDTGIDFQMFGGTGEYYGPAPGPDEGGADDGSLASETFVNIEETGLTPIRPAAYVEASISPIEEWLIVPGVRVDYAVDGDDWTVDPRLSSRLQIAKGTTLKGGVGWYSQAPEYWEIMDVLGNPDAKPFRTLQTSGGVEQKLGDHINVDLEGFYKRWDDRLVGTEGGAPPRFVNEGIGKAYGMEVLVDVRLTKKSQAFASYTLSRSRRKDGADQQWRFFDYDQTHNLSLTANYDLGRGWLVGARFRYVTGDPSSEVEGSVYDASTDTYRPLFRGVNEGRNSSFHQLDVRVEKMWEIGPVDLTSFLEIMNVYNANNIEGTEYSFDYRESSGVSGMPFFPNLGIRGEF